MWDGGLKRGGAFEGCLILVAVVVVVVGGGFLPRPVLIKSTREVDLGRRKCQFERNIASSFDVKIN